MNKYFVVFLAAALVLLFGNSVYAAKQPKVSICHNGGTYNSETREEEKLSFVITISGNAVPAHIRNHQDCPTIFSDLGDGLECELQDDGMTVICETVTLCECITDPTDPVDPVDPIDPGNPPA